MYEEIGECFIRTCNSETVRWKVESKDVYYKEDWDWAKDSGDEDNIFIHEKHEGAEMGLPGTFTQETENKLKTFGNSIKIRQRKDLKTRY